MSERCEDLISRQAAIAVADYSDCVGLSIDDVKKVTDEVVKGLKQLPSAQPEPLTDKEQRIFLAAMTREELMCLQIDEEFNGQNLVNLVEICHEITRKVKGALWI